MLKIRCAPRVAVVSIATGYVFYAHSEFVERMLGLKQVRMDEGLEKKALRGKEVFVERVWLDNKFPKEERALHRNSSTTVYKVNAPTRVFNERGEQSVRTTRVISHFHKPIPVSVADLYGRSIAQA